MKIIFNKYKKSLFILNVNVFINIVNTVFITRKSKYCCI